MTPNTDVQLNQSAANQNFANYLQIEGDVKQSFPNNNMLSAQIMQIIGAVQSYDWGITGMNSLVAQLALRGDPDLNISEEKQYAELWMGTHPTAPSHVVLSNGQKQLLGEYLGDKDIPFLFKVLSVGKALSIQAHPDIKLAQELHASRPQVYKDSNHKPEMAIALTPFEALCSFRPVSEIALFLNPQSPNFVPEFFNLISSPTLTEFIQLSSSSEFDSKELLKNLFTEIMNANPDLVDEQIVNLKARLSLNSISEGTPLERLAVRLSEEHPNKGEVGVFCVFLLNYITMLPGEAIFLAANEPHAYLKGDCVECMALSDNVVRAGLTPKLRDVPTLLKMLSYESVDPKSLFMNIKRVGQYSLLYEAPVAEFSVLSISLDESQSEILPEQKFSSILICVKCNGQVHIGGSTRLVAGSILLLQPGVEYKVITELGSSALLFQAFEPSSTHQ